MKDVVKNITPITPSHCAKGEINYAYLITNALSVHLSSYCGG